MSNEDRFTPGPYKAGNPAIGSFSPGDEVGKFIYGPGPDETSERLAFVFQNKHSWDETMATAQLMALAPELFAELKNALKTFEDVYHSGTIDVQIIGSAAERCEALIQRVYGAIDGAGVPVDIPNSDGDPDAVPA